MVWYKYIVDPTTFTDEDAMSFYLLGAYMTDGCIEKERNAIKLAAKDTDWIDDIKNVIHKDKPLIYETNRKLTTLNFSSEPIKDWLISWGCTPAKSLTLKIEKEIPKQFIPDFLRGVIDGDGSVSFCDYEKLSRNKQKIYKYKKSTTYICSASEIFINQLTELIPNNINYSVIIDKKPGDFSINKASGKIIQCKNILKRISFSDSSAAKFLNYVYYKNCFAMSRKLKLTNEIIDHYKNKNINLDL